MQEGMLFQHLYDSASEAHFGQSSFTLQGNLNVLTFEQAWQEVVDRHPLLRTLFLWERRERPLQVVRERVSLPFEQLDWRGLSPDQQQEQFEIFLRADRARGFDFTKAPLMRLTLIRLTDESYRLVWSRHHIIIDGWSFPLILDQVFASYRARSRGDTFAVANTRPYRDYIVWLQKQDLAKAENHWRKTLKGFTSPTLLGIRTPRKLSSMQGHYDAHRTWLSESVTATLQLLARKHQLTVNTVLQGAWSLLLSHYSGEEDIVFGTTVSGRPAELEGIERMVGLFINTLPMRVKLNGDEFLLTWLKDLQQQQVEMRQYEYSPLVQVQEWSELPARQPLFESIFVFESYPVASAFKKPDSELKITDVFNVERSDYPLTMIVGSGKRLLLKIAYDESRFESATIERMLKQLQVLLERISANPQQHVASYSLLEDSEKHRMLVEWNNTTAEYPVDCCVHQLFETQVESTPDAIAVRYGEEQLTYSELNASANRLAHYLRHKGVGPEVRVALMVEPSVDMIVGLLAILKAGGAYVPLDLAYPPERLRFMLNDSDVHLLVTQQQHLDSLLPDKGRSVCTDTEREAIDKQSQLNPETVATAENLAYIIYTSGSTGIPKGVCVSHRAINRLVFNPRFIAWNSGDRIGQVSNSSFDALTFEVWGALLHGALLIGVSKDVALSAQDLATHIEEQGINVMFLTSSLFNQIAAAEPRAFKSMRHLLVGGEAADPKFMKEVLARGAPENLRNAYGPTEATTFAVSHLVAGIAEGAQTVPIGVPLSNTQAYILNRHLQLVPVGTTGELYLGGPGLARGYWDRPELTAEKFVPHPYGERPGERLYSTGDIARYLPDGAIECLGRRDEQVKVRGFRIELGEIEAVLAGYAGIGEQVVIVREDQPGDKRLVAYLVNEADQQHSAGELRQHLQARLPYYMVPSAFVEIPALPLTANGKLDRAALPIPEQNFAERDSYIRPRSGLEEEVVRVWSEVLRLDPIGVHDNFFDLGGHSLLAMQVISKLRQSLQLEIPLHTLFDEPTPAQFSLNLNALRREDSAGVMTPITAVSRDQSLPLSFAQQRLWFLDQLQPGSSAYNIPVALRLNGQLSLLALERSLGQIVRRHEVLRSCFPMRRGEAVQIVREQSVVKLEMTDLSHVDQQEREGQAQAVTRQEGERPFDLATGPLFRSRILKLGHEEHVLLLTMHHIVSDGWSLGILMKELNDFYASELLSTKSGQELTELAVQYVDYAVWQRDRLVGDKLEDEMAYWREELKGVPLVLDLSAGREPRRVRSNSGAIERMSVNPRVTREIKTMITREDVTLFMFLLTAFSVLMHYHSKQEDIVVGVDVANRDRSEIEGLIGLFVNQVVMRTDLSGKPTFQDLLVRLRAMTLRVYAHQDFPFDKLVDGLKVERQLGRNPIFQVMFGLQNLPRWSRQLPGLTVTPLHVETPTTIFDLSLYMTDAGENLIGSMRYSTDLFTPEAIKGMVDGYQTILKAVTAQPSITLERLCEMLLERDKQLQVNRQTANRELSRRMLGTVKPQAITASRMGEMQ
jgi:amino acid adenylation domain-containing protein